MKAKSLFFILLITFYSYSQDQLSFNNLNVSINQPSNQSNSIGNNGYLFEIEDAGANSEYSEYVSGFFKNKVITVSSKKRGVISKIDANTNEAYKDLYCLNYDENGYLSYPLSFSKILNTVDNEDQLAFSSNKNTVYYTRSSNKSTLEYKIYKADLKKDSHGEWINAELLDINKENTSIENPYINPKGDKLFFSSNMSDSYGGYDIYVSDINKDGSLSSPKNLGKTINTTDDDKYPSLSNDSKYLYFASKGHNNLGGFDLFSSKIVNEKYNVPRNLGNTINTVNDEVAFYLIEKDNNKGYISSNKPNGYGGLDIYLVKFKITNQNLKGKILDTETNSALKNVTVILKDDLGNEIDKQVTDENGNYNFNVIPIESYTITTQKENFKDGIFEFESNRDSDLIYYKDLVIESNKSIITETKDKLFIDNIYFDFNKHSIKTESYITLDNVIQILNDYSEIKLNINAHTDNVGTNTYNLRLSKKRAKSTLKYLTKRGVSKDRLQTQGFGEETPYIDCKSNCKEEDHKANRRVEFMIINN